ncbi:MAG: hypothetical protein NTY22_04875 [Proteobacteria bacterium]|nr:hypothetical protein [Pseudomonadota bacterium]
MLDNLDRFFIFVIYLIGGSIWGINVVGTYATIQIIGYEDRFFFRGVISL